MDKTRLHGVDPQALTMEEVEQVNEALYNEADTEYLNDYDDDDLKE